MSRALKIVFKELTNTDFARINSAGYSGGGGQAYVDFRKGLISIAEWDSFFDGISTKSIRTHGPAWTFDVMNLGVGSLQPKITAYQRRPSTVSITEQKLPGNSKEANRLQAWTPNLTGFPDSKGPIDSAGDVPNGLIDDLRIFLIRDDADQIWAGWRQGPPPPSLPQILEPMFLTSQGMLEISGGLELDLANPQWPFATAALTDGPDWDDDDELAIAEPNIGYSVQKVRKRDRAAASAVRKLYTKCQISGDTFLFSTKAGKPYLEVHHLIPLGKGGADSPHNMIVVSPQIHKMLHYADVAAIDLSQVASSALAISINGKPYTITWHPLHAARVLAHNQP